jgi:N-acetylglucosaminyldiphosphoundecaprenol N-acetyl-beta-D-mannosaminyltransferase
VQRDRVMRRFYAMANIIEIDSMPLVGWGRVLGVPLGTRHRCTYLDWREDFWRRADDSGWRVFFLGGAVGVAERAGQKIKERWSRVTIDVHHGYFDHASSSPGNNAVIGMINDFSPDVIFVGLGMPQQEKWVALNFDRLKRGVLFSVGAAFDYEAGVQVAAPRWVGTLGLEWLYRFSTQPKRLFCRYFVESWSLVPLALRDVHRALVKGTHRTIEKESAEAASEISP